MRNRTKELEDNKVEFNTIPPEGLKYDETYIIKHGEKLHFGYYLYTKQANGGQYKHYFETDGNGPPRVATQYLPLQALSSTQKLLGVEQKQLYSAEEEVTLDTPEPLPAPTPPKEVVYDPRLQSTLLEFNPHTTESVEKPRESANPEHRSISDNIADLNKIREGGSKSKIEKEDRAARTASKSLEALQKEEEDANEPEFTTADFTDNEDDY